MVKTRLKIRRPEIVRLTRRYGGNFEVHHAERLIRLAGIIGAGKAYDPNVVWVAAYLHDWGACPQFVKANLNHSIRSMQVAREYMENSGYPAGFIGSVLEAIEFHHGGAAERSMETLLLADADALDGLGVVGILKEFACTPTAGDYCVPLGESFRDAYERAQIRMENNFHMLKLPASRELARTLVARMQRVLAELEEESGGHF